MRYLHTFELHFYKTIVIAELLYKWFPKQFNQLVWDATYKPDKMRGLKFAFVCEGHRFYVFDSLFEMPLERLGRAQDFVMQLQRMVSDQELTRFLDSMESALFESTNAEKLKSISRIGFLIGEMKERKKILIHPEIMMELASCMLVREDQDPADWNDEFEQKKVEMFRRNYKGKGLYDFFVSGGLKQFFPNLDSFERDWETYLEMSQSRLKALEELMKSPRSVGSSTTKTKSTVN